MRFFGRLKYDEIASVLDVSPRTVKSDWEVARTLLIAELYD